MKKIIQLSALLFLCQPVQAKLNIVTTTPDLADIARHIGQDQVEVKSLYEGNWDPHYLEPKPSHAVKLKQADLLILIGLDLEQGWLPVLLTQARNPKLRTGETGYLDASTAISAIEIPQAQVDRSAGDVHPYGNPHYWLDPNNGLKIAELITKRLAQLDPKQAQTYLRNQSHFSDQLKTKIAQWDKRVEKFSGMKIISYHNSYAYFAQWAGLKVVNFLEPKPGIPPTPKHLAKLITEIRQQSIKLIILAAYNNPKSAKTISENTGATNLILPTSVGGNIINYFDLFEVLITKLEEPLQ